jgi:hypothetical protein
MYAVPARARRVIVRAAWTLDNLPTQRNAPIPPAQWEWQGMFAMAECEGGINLFSKKTGAYALPAGEPRSAHREAHKNQRNTRESGVL